MKVVNRIKKYSEFQKVISEGSLIRSNSIYCYFLKNDLNHTRFGISIPTKSGHAVHRNKMKRQIRAAIAQKCDYSKSYDIIVIARKDFDTDNYAQTLSDIEEIIQKVG